MTSPTPGEPGDARAPEPFDAVDVIRTKRDRGEVSEAALRWMVDAYTRGVNAWIASRGSDLPPELRLLRTKPEPWSPADSLSIVFMMARQLSAIFEPNEEEMFVLLRAFGADDARALEGDADATVFDEIARLASETPAAGEKVGANAEGSGLGSNNWAVAPSRSASTSSAVSR